MWRKSDYILKLLLERILFKYLIRIFKKSGLVLATSALMTKATKKDNMVVKRVFSIHYPVLFKNNEVLDLINFDSKVNAMILEYALKLGLKFNLTDVKAQKIDSFILNTFEIVLASFHVENKLGQV